MTELPFDPYEPTPGPPRRRGSPRAAHGENALWVVRTQVKAWFFGWLFYCFGLTLLLAMTIHAVTDIEGSDMFAVGLIGTCAWIALFLQYRFPIGGPRAAPSRAEKRAATLGPRWSTGKALLGAGVVVGTVTSIAAGVLWSELETGGTFIRIAFLAGNAVAAGCIFLGRRFLQIAERSNAELPASKHS